MGRLEFHLPFNLKEEVTAAQFVELPAALKRNACTLCLSDGESLKLFTTDQSSIRVMALIGLGTGDGGGSGRWVFSLSKSEATGRPSRDDRRQLDKPLT